MPDDTALDEGAGNTVCVCGITGIAPVGDGHGVGSLVPGGKVGNAAGVGIVGSGGPGKMLLATPG